nr:hypothetical protein GCM10020093_081380 [Planobispora longispora]
MDDAEQQVGVGAGPDEHVLVGEEAVRVRRGSTTTNLPPRRRSAFSRPGKSGAVQSEPLDSSGLAPSISR